MKKVITATGLAIALVISPMSAFAADTVAPQCPSGYVLQPGPISNGFTTYQCVSTSAPVVNPSTPAPTQTPTQQTPTTSAPTTTGCPSGQSEITLNMPTGVVKGCITNPSSKPTTANGCQTNQISVTGIDTAGKEVKFCMNQSTAKSNSQQNPSIQQWGNQQQFGNSGMGYQGQQFGNRWGNQSDDYMISYFNNMKRNLNNGCYDSYRGIPLYNLKGLNCNMNVNPDSRFSLDGFQTYNFGSNRNSFSQRNFRR